ncbi:MAG: cytochrome c biogenesis protein ResB, partial [Chloroflexota bacterium]
MNPSAMNIHFTRLPTRVPVVRYFWRLFCSVRFALILILSLAGGFFLGVIISQVPQETAVFTQDYANWIEVEARPRYGVFTNLFFLLGLFDVFHAVWFRSLLTLLFVAITVCTLNRFPAIYQTTVKAKPVANEGFLRSAKHRAEFDLAGDEEGLAKTLRRQGYRLTLTRESGKLHVYGDKYGWAKYLTFVSHLGLLTFLFGGLMTNLEGYQKFMVIPDGMSQPIYPVYHPDQMQVLNENFTVEYYEDGRPRDYYSDLIIYKGGKEATRGRIRVNTPLDFDGFRFHQNSFGPTVQVRIKNDQTGQMLFSETLVLSQAFGAVPYETVSIPTPNINAVVALAEGNTTSNVVGGTFIRGGQEAKLAVMGFKSEGGAAGQPDFVVRLAPGETRT